MDEVNNSAKLLRFGIFEADLPSGELRKNGRKVRIQDLPFRLLAVLLEHPGEVFTREELRQRLWPADTFVEFEHSLNAAVAKLRTALGDSADTPRFIETIPRRGYRFLADVETIGGVLPQEVVKDRAALLWSSFRTEHRWQRVAVAVGVAVITAALIWFRRSGTSEPEKLMATVPLTTYPGIECCPSFSPDGNQVVFSWNGPQQDNFDIYVKMIGEEKPLRLTTDPAVDTSPVWSPDGRFIAFIRELTGGRAAVVLIPPIGGPERTLTETSRRAEHLSWAPDGRWLAVPDKDRSTDAHSLFLLSVETGDRRRLTVAPDPGREGDDWPAFSPDGRALAFVRRTGGYERDLYLLRLAADLTPDGQPTRITSLGRVSTNPAWTPDGRQIAFSSGQRFGDMSLWRTPADGSGTPERLISEGMQPAISLQGNRLAYQRLVGEDVNVWRIGLPDVGDSRQSASGGTASEPVRLLSSTRADFNPQYSPDGSRIVFHSTRSGTSEVWVCDSDGSHAVELTSMRAATTGSPRWSPDGKRIVFDSDAEGQFELYVINADRGKPTRLTRHPADDGVASWSRDGRWIYFASNRTGESQIWKMASGGGDAVQVTRHGGRVPFESADGSVVYYAKSGGNSSLWKVSATGGEETQVLDSIIWLSFAVVDDGIYFVPGRNPDGTSSIQFLSFATGKIQRIAPIEKRAHNGLSVSPDRRWILYAQGDEQAADLMLVENFR